MKKIFTKVLLTLLVLVSYDASAQYSPSSQVKVTTPSILSGCARDTIFLEFTNKEGPTCVASATGPTPTIEFVVHIPDINRISFQSSSVGSTPSGALETALAGDSLKFTAPVPSFGTTTKVFFVLNATCDVTGLTPLPQLEFIARYPSGFTTTNETWKSAKMNVGVGQITFTPVSSLIQIAGFGAGFNCAENITNTGFGVITELTYHQIMHDSFTGSQSHGTDHIYLRLLQPNDVVQNSTAASNYPDYQITDLGNGYRYYSVTIKGDDLDEFDGQFNPGDVLRINSSYLRAPTTCVPEAIQKQWVSYKCIGGTEACEIPDTIFRTFKVSAGTPIIAGENVSADTFDGCPLKNASFTFKNNGVGDVSRPEVSTAYDVDLSVALGGNITISNLVFSGVTTVPTVQSFPGTANAITWNIKDQLTFDPDGPGVGLEDLDGDLFFDDLAPGDSINVSFQYTVDCDLACGIQLDYNITANSKYTDFCRKLNGSGSTPIYRFGFAQTNAVTQITPLPNLGALATGSKTGVEGDFTFNYRHYGMDTSQAIVKLRLNYGNNQQIIEPITFLGMSLTKSDFTVLGTESVIAATDTAAGHYDETVDTDSAWEYTLTKADIALLLDNTIDGLTYSMAHIACDSFQSQTNTAGWSILYQINNTNCPPVPCALDLSCGKAFAYNYTDGCGSFPCFNLTDSIYRTSPWGHTNENQTTGVTPTAAGTSNFYEGDTITQLTTAILSGDVPLMEPLGQAPVNAISRGFYSYFSWSYDKPADLDMTDLKEQYLQFVEAGSRVRVYDTTTNTLLYDLPLKLSYFNNYGTTLGNDITGLDREWSFFDNATHNAAYTGPSNNGVPGIGLGDHWCNTNSWTLDNGSCPFLDTRWRDLNTTTYLAFENVAKTRVSEYNYIYWEKAFIDNGISFDPGYTKYKWEIETKWRVNPEFPHTNVSDFVRRGGVYRAGNNLSRPYEARTLVGSCATSNSLGTAVTNDLLVEGPGADYNSTCGLTVHNKLKFTSVAGDFFPSEVRVPHKLDSFTVDLPVEYHTTTTTPTTLDGTGHGSTLVNGATVTGTASGGGLTGHLVFTNNTSATGTSYSDFPRFSDADGLNTIWDISYPISNVGTDNSNIDGYKVPVTFYTRDEFGNVVILIDTFTISEAKPEITMAPLGGPVQINDGGSCSNSYMDVLVSNNTIYGADNVYIAALSNAGATIVSIQDAPGETPDDPIVDADTNVYGASNIYAELGGMIAGGRRIVRISFNSTVCDDSIKLYSNFGCNYPVAREPDNFGNTLDSAQITYNAVPPSMMSGPVDGNKNIANLCDTQTLEIEVRNVKNPNLSNIMAGIKLPANVRYVPNTAEIAYPTNLWVAAPTTTVVGTDSININISSDIELAIACGLPGADETKFPNINFAQTNASNANVFKVRFDVDFVACPTSSSDEVFYDIKGYNYCGDSTITVGVFNLIYSGVATAPNVYSCQPANSTPLEICGDSGTATNVADSMYINNTSGPVTVAGDSIEITIASDTGRFDISNFTVAAPWTAPVVGVSAAGRTTLKYEIPSGVATGDSILMVMNYDITPKVDNACFAAAIPCSAIAHSMSFYSSVSVECVAKGLTCTSLGTVTKGAGYVPRELACCKQGLGNFVWLDDDKDGIQDPGEVGVAGVSVDLYANGPDGLPNTADDVLVGSTKTDAYGKYYFNDIPTGDYNVAFTPPSNYTFTNPVGAGDNMDNTNSEVDTAAANFGRTGTFSITPGEQDSTVDAGLVLPTPTTATVGDYVWFDTDMDGVQDGTESGVAGVLVTLLDASGNVVSTALTDANGKYLFKDVEPGTYSVKFKAPMGTTFTTTGSDGVTGTAGDATDDSDADTDGKTGSFTVAAGDNIRNVDAGIIPQTNQKTSLGDRVWFDTNQDGIQDDGEVGIEGVMVILRDSAGMALDTTFTDINGNYSFDNLDSGKYIVKFVAPAGFTASPASTAVDIYGDGADMSDSDADQTTGETGLIHLLPGRRNSTVDAGFYNSNTNSIGDKVWYDTNKDGDQDVGEAGVQGVTVKLLDASGNPVNNPATGKPYVVQTDAEGNYKFVGLPNGMYTVEFANLPDGYVLTGQDQGGNNTTDSDADPNTGRTAAVNLTGNTHITHLDAGIYAGDAGLTASLGDKVWYDLDNDGIQDPGETGVEGITVTLKDYGPDGVPGGGDDGPDQTTTTNANGEYIFTGLDASNYVVQFSDLPAGYNPSPANAGGDDNADSDGGPLALGVSSSPVIRLSAGEENLSVDLGIYKAGVNSIGNKVWLDANQDGIQDASEIPVPGVQVTLLDGDGNIFDIDPSTPGVQPYTTTTDKEGNYLFTDLPDGTYSVKFAQLPNGYVFSPKNTGAIGTDSDADPATGKTGNVTVTGGQTNLTLDAGIYSSTKAALGNKVWSDDDGDGVQDPGEDGIAGVLVTLYDGGGNAIATTITDANGNYLFPNLDPGTYTVGFTNLPDGTTFTGQDEGGNDGTDSDVDPATGRTAPVTLAAGDVNLTVDAGVKPPATATVGNYVWFDKNRDGIQDADEPGVPGVIVTLRDGNGNVIGTTVTDGDGKYLFTNVPAGTGYTVTFDANLPYLGPSISSPHFTIQDASNTGGNKSIVPNTGAYNGLTATTPPFNVTAGSHTRLLDAGISSAFPLPVEMIELDILWVGDYSKVIWKTATEINNSHFEVERSLDGVNFVKVGEVNSKAMNGNSNSILSYDFMEDLASYSNHIFYYRVIQVDYDGASETSRILVLVRKELVNTSGITIQPNPAKTEFNVHVNALGLGSYTMDLIDVNGSVLNTYSSDKSEDEISFEKKTINVRNLPAGVYFVRIKMNDKITTSKIVILK